MNYITNWSVDETRELATRVMVEEAGKRGAVKDRAGMRRILAAFRESDVLASLTGPAKPARSSRRRAELQPAA